MIRLEPENPNSHGGYGWVTAYTKVDSSQNFSKIVSKIDVYSSGKLWYTKTKTSSNSNECLLSECTNLPSTKSYTAYGCHELRHTKSYVVYTSY